MAVARFHEPEAIFSRLVHFHGMADPVDLALSGNDESARDAIAAGGLHPSLGHGALVALLAFRNDIHGDSVGHLVAHLIDERLHQRLVVLPDAHADERNFGVLL